jgi:hypothetical protein
MAMFKIVVATQLKTLLVVFLLGSAYRVIPADPDNACGWDIYSRVVLAHHSLVLVAFSAATLLFMVWTDVRDAEATRGAKAFDAARHVGIGSIAAGRKRRSLRGTLLLAVALSFAASVLAVVAFEDGVLYRTGCHPDQAGPGAGSLPGMLVIGHFALMHGFFTWVAVTEN